MPSWFIKDTLWNLWLLFTNHGATAFLFFQLSAFLILDLIFDPRDFQCRSAVNNPKLCTLQDAWSCPRGWISLSWLPRRVYNGSDRSLLCLPETGEVPPNLKRIHDCAHHNDISLALSFVISIPWPRFVSLTLLKASLLTHVQVSVNTNEGHLNLNMFCYSSKTGFCNSCKM